MNYKLSCPTVSNVCVYTM